MDATVNSRVVPMISDKNPLADLAPGNALVAGMRLREFEITETLGEGGFSIVYGARDLQLMREVAIKEYIPISLAGRVASTTVRIRSEHNRETFEAGLNGFINEARLLAQFKHPGLVEVLQFWEENGTAYMVMPRYTGKTLRSVLKEMGGRGDEPWLRGIVAPVLDVLEMLHARNVYHRDIAPDNILIKNDGTPVLLDLGSAREVVTGLQKAITVVVKPGYAPIEQYSSDFALPQGPWTDVYAVGALLHFALTGSPPPASISRIMKDNLQPLSAAGLSGYSREFLAAVDKALMLQPTDRPQSIAELREMLRVTENDKTIIELTPEPELAELEEPLLRETVEFLPEPPALQPAVATPPPAPPMRGEVEDERTVIVSAQEVAALVQQLAGAKAAKAASEAAAAEAAASAAAAAVEVVPPPAPPVAAQVVPPVFAEPVATPVPATVVEEPVVVVRPVIAAEPPPAPVAVPPPAPLAAAPLSLEPLPFIEPLPPAEPPPLPRVDAPPLFAAPVTPAAVEKPVEAVAAVLPPAAHGSVPPPPSFELTLEPMVLSEETPAKAEPVVVSEFRLPPEVIVTPPPVAPPAPVAASAADSEATVVMPAPRALLDAAAQASAARPSAPPPREAPVARTPPPPPRAEPKPAAPVASDATVVMAAPDALALARSLSAATPPPVAANANEATLVMPIPVPPPQANAVELDPLAAPVKREKVETNSFPEMEDLLSGRLTSEARPVAVPAQHKPARADTPVPPAAAAKPAANADGGKPWLLPVSIAAAVLVIVGGVGAWMLLSGPSEAPPPPPLVAETPATPPAAETTPLPSSITDSSNTLPTGGETPALASGTDPNAALTPAPGDATVLGTTPAATDPAAASTVAAMDPNAATPPPLDSSQVLTPVAPSSESTSAALESPGQTLPPATPEHAQPIAATPPPAATPPATVAPATPSADTIKTVDLTGTTPRRDTASAPREPTATRKGKDAKPAMATTGNVKLGIQPWGEVWVNGSLKGVSPPMRFLQLEPGTYNIELRNPGLQSVRKQLTVVAGQPTTLEHRFQATGEGAK